VIPNSQPFLTRFFFLLIAAFFCSSAHASGITLSPDAARALDQIYSGDPDAAIATAHSIEQAHPDSPVDYLLEDEAEWWKMYCAACATQWGMLDAWKRPKAPEDQAYFALTQKAIDLAHAQLAKSDTAEMHLYAGLGYALEARLRGLRDEHRATARAGVAARAEFLRALQLDPDMADATAGLGLYDYYIDSLSGIVKVLRFFMGIPGGNKEEGIRQMRVGIDHGVFLAVDSRFYLAKNLRTYDQRYADAIEIAEPLATRYPRNPVFLLLLANLNQQLGRKAKASEYFHATLALSPPQASCATHVHDLATSSLASLR
jgi:tetratricopeptide (TPR) repeat protein